MTEEPTDLAAIDDKVGVSEGALQTIASYSAVAGLCPLIPVPFVDDVIITKIHRRLCVALCEEHGASLSSYGAQVLTTKQSNALKSGCVAVVLYPIKKLLRKVFYFLAIKSCADVAALVFHEGWLLARALEQGYVELDKITVDDKDTIHWLRDGIVTARETVDPSPTQILMKSSFGVGREVFGGVLGTLKGVLGGEGDGEGKIKEAQAEAAPFAERIVEEVRGHWQRGDELDAALQRALAEPQQLDAEPEPAEAAQVP